MPYIEGRHHGRAAIVRVAIIDAARHKKHKQSQKPILDGVLPYRALIDTGATSTMVSPKIVEEMKLQPVGKLQFSGLGGTIWKTAYLFHVAFFDTNYTASLRLDDGDQHAQQPDPINKIHIYKMPINGGKIQDDLSFDVLLGMDVLTSGVLKIDRNGSFSFSY